MIKKIRIEILCAFFFTVMQAQAQNVEKDFSMVNSYFTKNKNLSFDVTVYVYSNKTDNKGELVGKGSVVKDGNNYYSTFDADEMIMSEKGTLVLNHNDKKMIWFNQKSTTINSPVKVDFNSILNKTDSIIFRGTNNNNKHYSIYTSKEMYKRTDVFIDAKNNYLNKIEYYLTNSTSEFSIDAYKTTVLYSNVRIAAHAVAKHPSVEKYIIKSGKTWKLNTAYKNWQLIIQY